MEKFSTVNRGRQCMVLILSWVSKVCWHHLEVNSCLHSGVVLKDSGEGKSFQ